MPIKSLRELLIHLLISLVIAIGLPLTFSGYEIVWNMVPHYYATACIFLFLMFLLSTALLKRRRYVYYLIFLALAYLLFNKLHVILTHFDMGVALEDLTRLQRLRVQFSLRLLLRMVIVLTIIYHYIVLAFDRQKVMQSRLRAELAMLKSQITPHFFFNSLNAIYGLALAKSDKVPRAIISLADMMRYVITDAKNDKIGIDQEIAYLDRYVELQRMRLPTNTKLHYKVDINAAFDIPPMLLITFYENAFKYGTSSQSEAEIIIELHADAKTLHLHTHNAIIAKKSPEISTGNGIANARHRLELMYPNRFQLSAEEREGYYILDLTIVHQ